jgi:hypothetical protein
VVLLVGLNSKRTLCIVCKNAMSDEVWNRTELKPHPSGSLRNTFVGISACSQPELDRT